MTGHSQQIVDDLADVAQRTPFTKMLLMHPDPPALGQRLKALFGDELNMGTCPGTGPPSSTHRYITFSYEANEQSPLCLLHQEAVPPPPLEHHNN